jgi:hypothetical protein
LKSGMTYRQLAAECSNPRLLFKQCIHPSTPDGSLAFSGFARPAFGSIPPCSEMQTRLIACVVSGEVKLPCTDTLRCIAKKDQDNWYDDKDKLCDDDVTSSSFLFFISLSFSSTCFPLLSLYLSHLFESVVV